MEEMGSYLTEDREDLRSIAHLGKKFEVFLIFFFWKTFRTVQEKNVNIRNKS